MFPIPQTSKALFQILHHTILDSHTEYTISILFPPLEKLEQLEGIDKNGNEEAEDEAWCRRKKEFKEGMKEKERSSRTKKGERTIIQNDAEEINEEMKEVKIKEDEKGKRMEEKERRMRENRKENFQKNEGGIILMKTRYSELLILHQELEKQFGAENLPPFPPKKCLGNQKEDFIERRKRLLEVYFNRLALKIDLRKEKIINRFIENHQESFNGPEKLVKLKLDNHQQKKETITNEDNIMRSQVFEEKDNEGKGFY